MKLYLLRHGLTEANEQRLYYGRTDLPLSEAGRRALCAGPKPQSVPRYFTGGLLRTEQTLLLLCGNVPHTCLPGLREMDFGQFEMKSYAELKDDPAFQRWCAGDNETNRCPCGEGAREVTQRALAALAPVLADGRDALCVTHGGVIAGLLTHWLGGSRFKRTPPPGCGWCVEFEDGRPRAAALLPIFSPALDKK